MHCWEVSSNTKNIWLLKPNEVNHMCMQKPISKTDKGNALGIFGGGFSQPAKLILIRTAENVSTIDAYNKVFVGRYSFESLYTPEFICEFNEDLASLAKDMRGTFFGTCRGIDLCNPVRFKRAIYILRLYNIKTIIVEGGDGSSRQVAETVKAFNEYGINIIFPIPMTIDGINGGESAGIREAVKLSIRDTEDMVSTSLNTRDDEAFGVCIIELQGRNRDDIMAKVLKDFDIRGKVADFPLNELLLKVIPANYPCNYEELIEEVNSSYMRTLILLSEGSTIKMADLQNDIKRKVRTFVVGHRSQANGLTSPEDEAYYNEWVDKACEVIKDDPYGNYCLAYNDGQIEKKPIDYYAKLNPKENQEAFLSEDLEALLNEYM